MTEQRFEQLQGNTKKNFRASDDQSIKQRTTLTEKRLSSLNELMESYRSLLNYAVEFYQLCEQVFEIPFFYSLYSIVSNQQKGQEWTK